MIHKTIPFTTLLLLFLVFSSCIDKKKELKKEENNNLEQQNEISDLTQNDTIIRCQTMEILEKHLVKTPDLRQKIDSIEKQCQAFIKRRKEGRITDLDTITIPTIVHVIYSNPEQNISDAQIRSQINVLNQDFSKSNTDIDQIPDEFSALASDIKIRFTLDSIIRVSSTRADWGTDDQMKFSSNGGSDVIDSATTLNIWVCPIGGGILGYAQFPGDSLTTDGIVISPEYFGTEDFVQAPFNQGRTATHEVGHWLNLRHIWGDGNCSLDDFVEDTPVSDNPNFGCPPYPTAHCNSNDMTMNYMDYVDDACMHMFSTGQMERMRAVFAEGGGRESFVKI